MKIQNYIIALFVISLFSCSPQVDDKITLGGLPVPSFDIIEGATPNDFILRNTTPDVFISNWSIEGSTDVEGSEVDVNIPKIGEYPVTLTTFNNGGFATLSKTITVTEDEAVPCEANVELLTDCTEKIWKIASEAAAIHVGPNLTETWWGNAESDIADRPCHWNDQYIFRENGDFEFVSGGDLWADSDSDGNVWPSDLGLAVGCQNSSDWPDTYKSWDSGLHSYTITESSLSVIGMGAWIGLYKIGTSGEVDSPQSSVTFNISEISADRMVIYTDYGGLAWRITLVSE